MTTPIILLDVDDVCADMRPAWVAKYNEVYEDNKDVKDWRHWTFESMNLKCSAEDMKSLLAMPKFYDSVKPMRNYETVVIKLRDMGFRIIYASSCLPNTYDAKYNWIKRHDPVVTDKDVMFGYHKELINGHLLVDDGPHNIDAFPNKTVLFKRSYNSGTLAHSHTNTWGEMPGAIVNALNTKTKYAII